MSVYWLERNRKLDNGVWPGQRMGMIEDHSKPKDGDGVRFEGYKAQF